MTLYVPIPTSMDMRSFMDAIYDGRFPLLKGGWMLLRDKRRYAVFLVLREFFSLVSTWFLISEHILGIMVMPVVLGVMDRMFEMWLCDWLWEVKARFREMANEHFYSLRYRDRKSTDNMESFADKVETAGNVMTSVLTWGIPIIVRSMVSIVSASMVLVWSGYGYIIPMAVILYGGFYKYYLSRRREELGIIRTERKRVQEIEDTIRKFRLQQFQNRQRDAGDLEKMLAPREGYELLFAKGWEGIAFDVVIFSTVITTLWLIPEMGNLSRFLTARAVYDGFRQAIVMVAHFGNQMASRLKDFDKYKAWYDKCASPEETSFQKTFPKEGLRYQSVSIRFPSTFELTASSLSIHTGDRIMIRGPSNAGKTQLLNAIQGLTDGAVMEKGVPAEFSSNFEYMNQQTREGIPTTGITLRQLLDGESNEKMIAELVKVAMVEHQFRESADYDRKLDELSGGERMRISIAYTLWQAQKYGRRVVIMDEPDQGLDEDKRIQMLGLVSEYVRTRQMALLVVFHGSDSDIPYLRGFDKTWVFEHQNGQTRVNEVEWSVYRKAMWEKAINALQAVVF